jgi:hypothetical protein
MTRVRASIYVVVFLVTQLASGEAASASFTTFRSCPFAPYGGHLLWTLLALGLCFFYPAVAHAWIDRLVTRALARVQLGRPQMLQTPRMLGWVVGYAACSLLYSLLVGIACLLRSIEPLGALLLFLCLSASYVRIHAGLATRDILARHSANLDG